MNLVFLHATAFRATEFTNVFMELPLILHLQYVLAYSIHYISFKSLDGQHEFSFKQQSWGSIKQNQDAAWQAWIPYQSSWAQGPVPLFILTSGKCAPCEAGNDGPNDSPHT